MSMKEKYESLPLTELKQIAKVRGLRRVSAMKKADLIERMLEEDEKDRARETDAARQQEGSDRGREADAARRQEETGKVQETDAARQQEEPDRVREIGAVRQQEEPDRVRETGAVRQQEEPGRVRETDAVRQQEGPDRVRETGAARQQEEPDRVRETDAARQWEEPDRTRDEAEHQRRSRPAFRSGVNSPRYHSSPDSQQQETTAHVSPRPDLDSGIEAEGILEVMADGFGFIRCENFLPGENDVYVAPSQIRRFQLRTGDMICGNTRVKTAAEKFSALLYVKTVNGRNPIDATRRPKFEDATPVFPDECFHLSNGTNNMAMRIVDLISPVGKGQRGMIVSPPKAGKTTLLKEVAKSITRNNREVHLIILLIDERPEEVTDIKESIQGENVEVIYSTFDELPDRHKRVSEMVLERAKRLAEEKRDVVILLDSITRLARAYNLTVPPSGRTLSGGLDPAALHMPKRFFGAARNLREGGSLTILATALVDTGSKMDDVVYEEFKGTGNMELVLDRRLSERRVFPAVDIVKSGTRREDLLLTREEQEAVYIMRRALNGMKADEAVERILDLFVKTRDNRELVYRVRKMKFI